MTLLNPETRAYDTFLNMIPEYDPLQPNKKENVTMSPIKASRP